MSSDAGIIEYHKVDNVGILTMRHAPHNLVGKALCSALIAALHAAQDDGCRALILKSGLRHFSAGADLDLFVNGGERMHELDAVGVLRAFDELPLPIVASVHGVALGGGFELALACDLIIAGASAKFGLVEATLGLHPLMGGIQRVMQRAGAARAKEIVMLGRRHDAATLEKWGIVNRVVADAQLDEVALSLARELAQGPTVAHAATKRLSNIYLDQGMHACDDMMEEVQRPIFASGDLRRGLESFATAGPGNAVFQGN
jgi:enoyl-CoA hydratase/carnithine racemase